MEEKVFVGYNFGQFQNNEGRMQDYGRICLHLRASVRIVT